MRNRTVTLCAMVLLAAATQVFAQDPPIKAVPPPNIPQNGLFDFGFRGSSVDGDGARYERYRDLRDGASTLFAMSRNTDRYRSSATGSLRSWARSRSNSSAAVRHRVRQALAFG